MDAMTQFIEQSAISPFYMNECKTGRGNSIAAQIQQRNADVLEVLAAGPSRTAVIGLVIGISTEFVSYALKRLQRKGLVVGESLGHGRAALWRLA